ncbi:MAG: hypothetical protein R3B54_03180 [Bdellovibrionota bacterium]
MRVLIFVLLVLAPVAARAQNHVVLFAEQELNISSLGHSGLQNLLQSTNDKSVKQQGMDGHTQAERAGS